MSLVELFTFNLHDKEYRKVDSTFVSLLGKEVKPVFKIGRLFLIYEIRDREKRYFVIMDKANDIAYIVRDDSEDLLFALAEIKAKLMVIYNRLGGNGNPFKFVFDNGFFYLVYARSEKEAKRKVMAIKLNPGGFRKSVMSFRVHGISFYLPYIYVIEYRQSQSTTIPQSFAIGVGYKDFSTLLKSLVSTLYVLRRG